MPRIRPALALALLLAGCGEAPPATAVRVELSGGPGAGTYQSTATTPACLMEATGPVGVQFTDWTGPKEGLRSLSLVVPERTRPGAFYLGMVFGDFFTGRVVEIDTRAPTTARGEGRVTLAPRTEGTTVTVTGATEHAVALRATITCLTPDGTEGSVP